MMFKNLLVRKDIALMLFIAGGLVLALGSYYFENDFLRAIGLLLMTVVGYLFFKERGADKP